MVPIYDEDGNLIGYEDAGDVTSEDDSWFWQSIGIDPKTISYTETSPTNEEIEKTLGISSSPLDFLKAVFSGKSSLGKAGQVAGILGTAALANKMFGSSGGGGFSGYQGSIPTYTASRTMNAIPTTMTVPTTGGGMQVVPRRPGSGGVTYFSPMVYTEKKADGGIASLRDGHLGSYSDGGQLLRGPGDGVSDDIPATIADKRPARLADGEFVIPARIVSELGNGSTEAGAKKLYAMMDRIKKARRSAKDIAADTKTDRYLPR